MAYNRKFQPQGFLIFWFLYTGFYCTGNKRHSLDLNQTLRLIASIGSNVQTSHQLLQFVSSVYCYIGKHFHKVYEWIGFLSEFR